MVKVKDQDKLPQPNDQNFPMRHCKVRDENDCWFIYTYAVRNNTKEVYVLETLGKIVVLRSIPDSKDATLCKICLPLFFISHLSFCVSEE